MNNDFNRKIVLEDGSEYFGYGFGYNEDKVCEIVFNTSMVGYQEIVSDPSYTDQMVVMTYPVIGNYGITDEDFETKNPTIGGLVVREYNDLPSNFRSTKTLAEILEEDKIPGIWGVDTRKLTRSIRDNGTKRVLITDIATSKEDALKIIAEAPVNKDVVSKVSCEKRWHSRTSNKKFTVVAIDCGIKLSIIKCLNAARCNVTILPWNTTLEEIEMYNPDGILISNGPGNPEDIMSLVELVKKIKGKYPVLGIGLGHQIISLAYGAKTYKLKFGHRGGNHPVRNLVTGKVEITGQNHGYAVDMDSLKDTELEVTHINILDNTVEGVECAKDRVMGIQYQPENTPEPQSSGYLFDKFIGFMKEGKENA